MTAGSNIGYYGRHIVPPSPKNWSWRDRYDRQVQLTKCGQGGGRSGGGGGGATFCRGGKRRGGEMNTKLQLKTYCADADIGSVSWYQQLTHKYQTITPPPTQTSAGRVIKSASPPPPSSSVCPPPPPPQESEHLKQFIQTIHQTDKFDK